MRLDGNTRALSRGLALFCLAPVVLALAAVQLVCLALSMVGLAFAFHSAAERSRWLPALARRLAGQWSGVPVASPYRPRPLAPVAGPDGLYASSDGNRHESARWASFRNRLHWVWRDPATWRDLVWLLTDPVIGGALAVLPAALMAFGVVAAVLWSVPGIVGGVLAVALGWVVAPWLLRLHGVWTRLLLAPLSAASVVRGRAWQRWFGTGMTAMGGCLVIASLSLVAVPIAVWCLLSWLGGPMFPARALTATRWLPVQFRRIGREWLGLDLPSPYRRVPGGDAEESPWAAGARAARVARHDPATWRDLRFLVCQPLLGLPLILPAAMIAYGAWGLVALALFDPGRRNWVGELAGSLWLGLLGGIALVLAGAAVAPVLLRPYRRWLPVLLAPTEEARLLIERERLVERVAELTETRAVATDTQAAEVRRIERDLHDGAQARLVAMGMTLGAVEALIDQDPAAARKMLEQARESSATALAELRGLIRGIHPPVLAERGLVDAIRALALDNPLHVEVTADLPGRAEPPVESAVYFAVAELLTNATRHSGAGNVWIDLRHAAGTLVVTVLDDGSGGANPDRGSGLRGLERRLGTFDGRVAVSSPPGGPTMVTMELPCALSSPRTSTSSETA